MPAWLPELCEMDGVWEDVVQNLYAIFRQDFADAAPQLDGSPVWWDRRVFDQFEEAFWHLITRDDTGTGDRVPDFRRAERLAWCGAILRNCGDAAVTRWRYREQNNRVREYLWLEEHDYVVVLEERPSRRGLVYVLITAYHIDGDSRRRSLRRKLGRREP